MNEAVKQMVDLTGQLNEAVMDLRSEKVSGTEDALPDLILSDITVPGVENLLDAIQRFFEEVESISSDMNISVSELEGYSSEASKPNRVLEINSEDLNDLVTALNEIMEDAPVKSDSRPELAFTWGSDQNPTTAPVDPDPFESDPKEIGSIIFDEYASVSESNDSGCGGTSW